MLIFRFFRTGQFNLLLIHTSVVGYGYMDHRYLTNVLQFLNLFFYS